MQIVQFMCLLMEFNLFIEKRQFAVGKKLRNFATKGGESKEGEQLLES